MKGRGARSCLAFQRIICEMKDLFQMHNLQLCLRKQLKKTVMVTNIEYKSETVQKRPWVSSGLLLVGSNIKYNGHNGILNKTLLNRETVVQNCCISYLTCDIFMT